MSCVTHSEPGLPMIKQHQVLTWKWSHNSASSQPSLATHYTMRHEGNITQNKICMVKESLDVT